METNGGEEIVRALKNEGTRVVFGMSGHGLVSFLEAIRKEESMKFINVRHEENAVHMADAWARGSGGVGICATTVGPGAAAAVPGIAAAWADGIPVVLITSNNPQSISYPFRGALEDLDSLSLFRPITKWNAVVTDHARIPELINRAYREALMGSPGPVHLDIPLDVWWQSRPASILSAPARSRALGRIKGDPHQIQKGFKLLMEAQRPLLIAGGGVIAGEAWDEFEKIATTLKIPATTTPMGNGSISAGNSSFIGGSGWLGGDAVMRAFKEADVILAVGCRFTNWLGFGGPPIMAGPSAQKIIHVDIDPQQIGKNVDVEIGLVSDAKAFLTDMLVLNREQGKRVNWSERWLQGLKSDHEAYLRKLEPMASPDARPISPAFLSKEIAAVIDEDALVCFDGGMAMMWSHTYLGSHQPRTRFFNAGMGQLGFGHPFANSLKMAYPARQVVNITGDGAFGFTLQELETAQRHGLNVVHVIHNDRAWGMCKFGQEVLFGTAERTDQILGDTDWTRIAEGFGCFGEKVEDPGEIKPALARAFRSGKPAVLDVRIQFIPHPAFQLMPAVVFQDCAVPAPPQPPSV